MRLHLKTPTFLRRHPILYYIRFILVSKNNKGSFAHHTGCFNEINKLEDIPKIYFEINRQISMQPDWDELQKAQAIGKFLRARIPVGPGLGISSGLALEKMLSGSGGVCSDFTQIFNIFCFINNIQVKEWGCIDRFYNTQYGHSFNEIYSTALQKWVLIDIHIGVVFHDSKGIYLSAVELFTNLRKGESLQFYIYSDYVSKKIPRLPLIFSKRTIPFLISNYRNKVNDHFMMKYRKLPQVLVNLIIILNKKNHNFLFVMDNYKVKMLPLPLQNH